MDDEITRRRNELVEGLKHYFNNDLNKVKRFGNQLKLLGFDLNDLETLKSIETRSEALITLLNLSNFGVLSTVAKSIMHIRGTGNPDEYIKQYAEKFNKIIPPN